MQVPIQQLVTVATHMERWRCVMQWARVGAWVGHLAYHDSHEEVVLREARLVVREGGGMGRTSSLS